MYKALVARVRYHIQKANFMGLKDAESTLLLTETADAIEELSKRIDHAVDLYNRNIEKTAMYEALLGIEPEPPKEES